MDEKMLEKMLSEIDSMTSEEYWALYQEAQKLPDFIPLDLDEWEAISSSANVMGNIPINNVSFSITFENHTIISAESYYSESEDTICPQAA